MKKRTIEEVHEHIVEAEGKPPDQAWFVPTDDERSIYRFIIAAAKRARQLQGGARPLISTTSRKPTKIAMEEIRTGEVAVEIPPDPEAESVAPEE
jgi:DNA-directed RNA polymerase subunit omega